MTEEKKGEKSFSLVEILLAMSLLALIVLIFSNTSSRSSVLTKRARATSKAMWLAKGVMSEVEYYSSFLPLAEMKTKIKDQRFKGKLENLCSTKQMGTCDYKYKLTIQPWKLDLMSALLKKFAGEDDSKNNAMVDMIKKEIKSKLGSELLYYAHVEVSWKEGIKNRSVDLSYLLTKQKELDNLIASLSTKKKS